MQNRKFVGKETKVCTVPTYQPVFRIRIRLLRIRILNFFPQFGSGSRQQKQNFGINFVLQPKK